MNDVKQVARYIAENYGYDHVIGMKEFESLLGVELPTVGSLQTIQAAQMARMTAIDQVARELLKEHSLMLQNVRAEGYRIVHPQVQVVTAVQESHRKIGKELVKAKRRVVFIRVDELSTAQQREREDALAKLSSIGKMLKGK